jgi:hypothetical protein
VERPDGRGPALTGRLDSVDTYNPASYRGGVLQLHYARARELGPWLDRVSVRGEVVVQDGFGWDGSRAFGCCLVGRPPQCGGAATARGRGAAHARARARGFNKGFKMVLIARGSEKVVKNQ